MRQHIGAFLRRFASYRRLRKVHEAGWAFTLRRWQLELQVLRTRPMRTQPFGSPGVPCEVRILVYEADSLMALWTAKSFYARSGVDWPLVWLQGGPISNKAVRRLREHFPDSFFIPLDEADATVESQLQRLGHNSTIAVRRVAVFLRRAIDFQISAGADRALFLDSDVLFFRRPVELLNAVAGEKRVNLFNKDLNNAYALTPDEAERRFGIRPVELLNAGLCLICRESIRLEEVDRYLSEPDLLRHRNFIDQLVYALLGASFPTAHLPPTYRLADEPGLTAGGRPIVARHYAGATRRLLYTEGMPTLIARGFLDELRP